jgi:hypothetical protein
LITVFLNPDPETYNANPQDCFWVDDEISEVLVPLHLRYARRAIAAYSGRNRNVFEMPGGYVIKLPRNCDGITDNDWEGSVSNYPENIGNHEFEQFARTRLFYYGEIPVLFMERVAPLTSAEVIARFGEEPDWVYSIDGGQVGVNRKGQLVAYDYGLT